MIALDTNIIVGYLVSSQPEHRSLRAWFKTNTESLATTAINLGETLRLLTHAKVFPRPLSLHKAIELVTQFLNALEISVAEEHAAWLHDMKQLCDTLPTLRGNEVFDARIALCLRHNGIREICTFDSDFQKYKFLRVITPNT